jgi:N-methylhydantoinase A
MLKIGIDVGGTFTDVVLVNTQTGTTSIAKVPSTPESPVKGALAGIRRVLEISRSKPEQVAFIGHGTTIATNLIVEGKGAPTALVATKGFRDLIEFRRSARHDRADLYDLHFVSPPPLVPRRRRFEADERVKADRSIERRLEQSEIDRLAAELAKTEVQAVAVSFLNAHLNADNEKALVSALQKRLPDRFICGSHEVNPEIFEYERTSTTIVNAMLGPKCGEYIRDFNANVGAEGIDASVLFMQSSGGLTPPASIERKPIVLMESGPAGGVTAGAKLCQQLGVKNAILGDVGGTTFDVSLIRNGEPERRNNCSVQTYVIRAPTIDIESVGAGGGSIAWVDEAGGLHIGPQSAGANPGPACYSRGGSEPTLTDCNFLLGYLEAESFSREIEIDLDAAKRAIHKVADPLGCDVYDAAETIRALTISHMAQAIRLMTVQRGYDPREFAYVCFGGSGPVHAREVVKELEMPVIVVPPLPGLFSATGMLVADETQELQAPILTPISDLRAETVRAQYAELEQKARSLFLDQRAKVTVRRMADCRYINQAEAITIEIPDAFNDIAAMMREAFEEAHRRHWNFVRAELPIVAVNLRISAIAATGITPKPALRTENVIPKPYRTRKLYSRKQWLDMPTYRRKDLGAGDEIRGPCIVEEDSSSIALGEGDVLSVKPNSALWISVKV